MTYHGKSKEELIAEIEGLEFELEEVDRQRRVAVRKYGRALRGKRAAMRKLEEYRRLFA